MWIIKSFLRCHAPRISSLERYTPSFLLLFSFSLPFLFCRHMNTHAPTHACTHTVCPVRCTLPHHFRHTHMHWSLSSPLLECSLVSAVMQSSPVISWELCVLHSLPSVLFFFPLLRIRLHFISDARGIPEIYMTKISLIPLTSKYPLQTVFISRIEIRYPNCLCHRCHLLLPELKLLRKEFVRLCLLLSSLWTVRNWTYCYLLWSKSFCLSCVDSSIQYRSPNCLYLSKSTNTAM